MKLGVFINKNTHNIYLFVPLILFVVFTVIFIINLLTNIWISQNQVIETPLFAQSDFRYPILKRQYNPEISAKGAIIMDANSKIVLYSKNPNLRFSTASTAKLMTAVVGSQYFKMNDTLTVKTASVEGSALGLYQGETLSFENLLYAMLLPSANDAALAISQNYPGGKAAFVNKMNKMTKNFKLSNTHFGDPAGLFDREDYTTPFDLARLAAFSIQNKKIQSIVSTKEKVITDTTGGNVYYLNNLNQLLGIDGVNGIKTGYTQEAGQVLVTSKKEGEDTLIIVVMGSEDRFLDTRVLLEMIRDNVTYLAIHP